MYAYIEPCACVCGRGMKILYLQAFLRVTACCTVKAQTAEEAKQD